jgi:hypothetical protein
MSPFPLIDTKHLRNSSRPAARISVQRAGTSAPMTSPRAPGESVGELRVLSVVIGTTLALGIVSFAAVEVFRFLFD